MAAKLLCVDDNKLLLRCFALCADRQQGFTVATASSASQALELEKLHGPFDVIIADYFMPGMNGIELLRRLAERHPGSHRFLQSSTTSLNEVQHALNEGIIAHFFPKPIMVADIEAMFEAVQQKCASLFHTVKAPA